MPLWGVGIYPSSSSGAGLRTLWFNRLKFDPNACSLSFYYLEQGGQETGQLAT